MALRTLVVVWIALGLALAIAEGIALVAPATTRGWISSLQEAYGFAAPVPGWARSDRHAHLLVSALACLWFALGGRLFAPRTLPWLPLALTALLILADEVMQLGGAGRSFELGDMVAGGLGLILAFPLVVWLQRCEVQGAGRIRRRPPATPPP